MTTTCYQVCGYEQYECSKDILVTTSKLDALAAYKQHVLQQVEGRYYPTYVVELLAWQGDQRRLICSTVLKDHRLNW